jgi:predicted RNase H-like HicB family nuclease
MTGNGQAGWPQSARSKPPAPAAAAVEYLVIVHPAGELDADRAARFWTEVPALAACTADGATVDEAVANTYRAIVGWLYGRTSPDAPPTFRLHIELAF